MNEAVVRVTLDNEGQPMTCEMTIGNAGMSRCGKPAQMLLINRFGVESRLHIGAYCWDDGRYLVRDEPYRRLLAVVPL